MAAPSVLGYGGAVATSDRIAGPVIASIAVVSAWAVLRPVRWTILPIAVWVGIAPLVLGAEAAVLLSEAASGIVLLALTPVGRSEPQRFGGGWRALTRT